MRRFLLAFVTLSVLTLAPGWIVAGPAFEAPVAQATIGALPGGVDWGHGAGSVGAQAPGLPASLMLIAGLSGLLVAGDRRVPTRSVVRR